MLLIPSRLIVRTIAGRSLRLWAVTRLALSFFFALAGNNPLHLSLITVTAIVALTTLLGSIELRKQREHLLLAGTGMPPVVIYLMLFLPPALGELAVMAVGLV